MTPASTPVASIVSTSGAQFIHSVIARVPVTRLAVSPHSARARRRVYTMRQVMASMGEGSCPRRLLPCIAQGA